MLADSLIGPEEDGFLESAIKTPEIDIQKHGHWTDVARLAELEEVVFEELIASHIATNLQVDLQVKQPIVE